MNIKLKLLLIWVLSITTAIPYIHAVTNKKDNNKSSERKASKKYFKEVCTEKLRADFVCTNSLSVNHNLNINNLCAQTVSTTDLCVSGNTRIGEICGSYRAWAQYSVDTTYTLGSPLNFDNIVDNPDGDLTTNPTVFTAPASGYYTFTLAINLLSITPDEDILLGAPNAVLTVYINGVQQTQSFFSFLTFNPEQNSTMSTLLRLQAGDQVTATYNTLTVDPDTGVENVSGTAVLKGGNGASLFAIHYLSSDCESSACMPCVPSPTLPCDATCIHSCDRD